MKDNKYLKLFAYTFYISAFTFGGGFVIIALMQKIFVDKLHWLDQKDMMDYVSIAQSAPGVVAVNASLLVGFHVGGILGSAVAILGTVTPPIIIISAISLFYNAFRTNELVAAVLKAMQAGVAAVILDVSATMGKAVLKGRDYINLAIIITGFVAVYFYKINVFWLLLFCAGTGALRTILHKGEKA